LHKNDMFEHQVAGEISYLNAITTASAGAVSLVDTCLASRICLTGEMNQYLFSIYIYIMYTPVGVSWVRIPAFRDVT
jgi:hypothetical protein